MPRSLLTGWVVTAVLAAAPAVNAQVAAPLNATDAPTASDQLDRSDALNRSDPPSAAAPDVPRPPSRRYALWLPLVEIPLMNVSLTLFNLATAGEEEWTHVTFDTILYNAAAHWEFDPNEFNVNAIGHPYQGSFAFIASRSAGFGFLGSMTAAGVSSVLWEIAGESEHPSVNDLINTTFGGAFLGEALYRTAAAIERSRRGPPLLRFLVALVFDPLGTLNRALLGARYGGEELLDVPLLVRLSLGINAIGNVSSRQLAQLISVDLAPELHLSAQLRSGFPASRDLEPTQPFDFFDLRGELSISSQPWGALFVSGLLYGQGWHAGPALQGTWGLFGGYDFSNRPVLRVSTVSAGLGATAVARLSEQVQLQGMLVLSGVVLGEAGTLPVELPTERDHHVGPGAQGMAELELVHRRWGSLHGTLRQYVVGPGYGADGVESVTYFTFGVAIGVVPDIELWFDAVLSARHANYGSGGPPHVDQVANQIRMGLSWLSDEGHGASDGTAPRP